MSTIDLRHTRGNSSVKTPKTGESRISSTAGNLELHEPDGSITSIASKDLPQGKFTMEIDTQGDTATASQVLIKCLKMDGKRLLKSDNLLRVRVCNDGVYADSTNATIAAGTGSAVVDTITATKDLVFSPVAGVAASETLTISGVVVDTETVTINGREYYYSTGATTVTSGSVAVDISAGGTKSQGKLTLIDAPTAGDTLTVGSSVYTYRASATLPGEIDLGGAAVAEIATITVAGGSVAQIETFTTRADASDDLDGTYITLYDEDGSVEVWIDTDDSGTAAPGVRDRAIEVTTIATDDTDESVATAVAAAIDGDSKFSASSAGAVVTVTHATAGAVADGADGDATFTAFTVTTDGSTNAWDQTYFVLQDTAGPVVFWMDIDNSGSTISAAATTAATGGRSVEITTVLSTSTNALAAALIDTAINADAQFSSSETGGVITVTNAEVGDFGDAADGDTGFTFAETTPGVAATAQAATVAAINGTDLLNDANAEVTIAAFVDNDAILTALYTGTAGDAINFADTFTSANNLFDDDQGTMGTETAGVDVTATQAGDALVTALASDSSAEVSGVNATGTVTITSLVTGADNNAITTTEGMANGAFGAGTMSGGITEHLDQFLIALTDGTAETVTLRIGPAPIGNNLLGKYDTEIDVTHAAP